jgi:hypothetical protein
MGRRATKLKMNIDHDDSASGHISNLGDIHMKTRTCHIKSLGTRKRLLDGITSVKLLGHKGKIDWSHNAEALFIKIPDHKPCDHAFVLAIR